VNTQSYYLMTSLSRSVPLEFGGRVLPIFRANHDQLDAGPPFNEHSRNFIYAGRLNPWKGPQTAIAAMKQLPQDCHLYIVGSGDMEKELREAVTAQGLTGRVTLTGHQDSQGIQEYYRKAIAVIVPSIIPENCPLVVLEAMMASRPVIASRIGGIPELVQDGVNGYLVTPNDPAALATAMKRVLRNIPEAREMGERGRAIIHRQKFDSEWHMDTLIQEYRLASEHAR
jgi:glycosyltransferase involved in cell wall biosynthesis